MTFFASLVSWLFSLLSAVSIAVFAMPGTPADVQDTVQRTLRWSGPGPHRLEVSAVNGSVHVVGYDGNDVQVTARRTIHAADDAAVAEARDRVQMSFSEGANAITVCADGEQCGCHVSNRGRSRRDWNDDRFRVDVDFEVRLPRDTLLTACTVNRGDMRVENVNGDFDVSNVNGPVTLSGMGGSGSATTVNGAVTATFASSPRSASTFKTVNGDIEATFPPDFSADLRLKTMNGGLYTDFEVTARPSDASATVDKRNGRTVYRTNQFATVRVGNGGPVLTFEGLNSNVRVLRAGR
jgi:hypothetical protein